jgi:heavy metal sensor kinase
LHRRFAVLAETVHQAHPHGRGRPLPGDLPPGEAPDDPPPPRDHLPPNFSLPPSVASWFDTNQPNEFYFILYTRDGNKIASAGKLPDRQVSAKPAGSMMAINRTPFPADLKPPPAWTADGFREILNLTPGGETIVVGCSLAPELHDLELAALNLTAIGGLILLVGLAGGWWFVGRALRPVIAISATAAKISAGDLSQRINVGEADSELGQLAAVLNSTFARLETAFAQQKRFAADAAHELRTPVSVMLTQTQTALNRERDAAGYKQAVEACQRAAQRMRRLIESLLELTRFDAGQEVLKRMKFDLAKTVADAIEMGQTLADERGVKIIPEVRPLEITGDPERLTQVVTNLLTNAIQFNQPEGEVRLNLYLEGGLGVLQISDTGKGISREDLPRVFERFYRADKSRTGAGNSGLGLSICKAIVEAHGGTIEVSSQPDAGATFIVRLPL